MRPPHIFRSTARAASVGGVLLIAALSWSTGAFCDENDVGQSQVIAQIVESGSALPSVPPSPAPAADGIPLPQSAPADPSPGRFARTSVGRHVAASDRDRRIVLLHRFAQRCSHHDWRDLWFRHREYRFLDGPASAKDSNPECGGVALRPPDNCRRFKPDAQGPLLFRLRLFLRRSLSTKARNRQSLHGGL